MPNTILICRHNKNGTGYCECLGEYCVEGPCTAEELIEYAPVRHAKWVSSEQYNGRPECPVCFYVTDEKTNYCPHCGCKMDREE